VKLPDEGLPANHFLAKISSGIARLPQISHGF
jgi:hypothetical protein